MGNTGGCVDSEMNLKSGSTKISLIEFLNKLDPEVIE